MIIITYPAAIIIDDAVLSCAGHHTSKHKPLHRQAHDRSSPYSLRLRILGIAVIDNPQYNPLVLALPLQTGPSQRIMG